MYRVKNSDNFETLPFIYVVNPPTDTHSLSLCTVICTRLLQYKCSAVAEMGDRLATINMGRKWWGLCSFGGELGHSPSNTYVAWAEAYLLSLIYI